ncbi:hypothetical protein J3R30DRAFT_3710029 [Lentinula aciculospora]|uniref:Uncharacterized protein n=1 Tax=Lentinula aciculospora TaxID=153920 RepID=A0A9W9A0D0_9AGAR|nr:hypothetical protein J3R30DRAFT_3710029 [Lentinula aciculospora]
MDRPIRERVFFLDDHDYHQPLPKTVNTGRRPVSMIAIMQSNEPTFPAPPVRRLSVHRPLRSSPLAGPALSSEGLLVPDEDDQRRCKPSRISSTPDLPVVSPYSSVYPTDRLLSPPHSGNTSRPTLVQRKTSPSYLGIPSVSLAKSPSAPSLHVSSTPPSSPNSSSRPPSRENATSDSSPTPTSPRSAPGDWLITNSFGDTPRFSRLSMGSNVVMPVPAKEYRRKSVASVKSIPNFPSWASNPPGLIVRSRSGSSGVRNEEADTSCSSNPVRKVESSKSISSLASKVRRRASTLLSIRSDSSESQSIESDPSMLQSRSVTSLSSIADGSDIDFLLSPSLPPRAPSSAHSRGSSNSDCAIIDEEAEDDTPVTPDCVVPLAHTRSLPEQRKESKREPFFLKFRRIIRVHRLIRPRVSDVS